MYKLANCFIIVQYVVAISGDNTEILLPVDATRLRLCESGILYSRPQNLPGAEPRLGTMIAFVLKLVHTFNYLVR